MSLFKLNEKVVDEDAKTVAHNLWSRTVGMGGHTGNTKRWGGYAGGIAVAAGGAAAGSAALYAAGSAGYLTNLFTNIFNFTDKIDASYFQSMYSLSDPLKKKLKTWCAKIKDSVVSGEVLKTAHTMDCSERTGHNLGSKYAGRAGGSSLSTATHFITLPALNGKGSHVLYFIFDGESIKEVKVLTYNGEDPTDDNSYKVVNLSNWNTVKPEEYKK